MDTIYHYLPLRDQSAGLRRQVTATILRVFAGWGYQEIEVPLIDDFDVVKRGLSNQQVDQALRFLDRSGHVMMLRTDSTPAVAKALSFQLEKTTAPQRVCYSNKVVRIEKGRTKSQLESYQIGVELIGIEGLAAEIELVCICVEVLTRLGLTDCRLNITDHGIVERVLALTGAPVRIRNDLKLAIIARDATRARNILASVGVREKFVNAVQLLAHIMGGLEQVDKIEAILGYDQELHERIQRLHLLIDSLNQLGFREFVRVDLAELQNPHYYDGVAFNVVSETAGRSIGSGGRYDQLFGNFGRKAPATGFGLTTDLICELVYPKVSASSPHSELSETILVTNDDLVSPFQRALERRQAQAQTRVVVAKSNPQRKP